MWASVRLTIRSAHAPHESFRVTLLRVSEGRETRTLMESVDDGGASAVSELVARGGSSLSHHIWQNVNRRWVVVRGVLRTDRFLETPFHYEDLGFAVPRERSRGTVERREENGRERVVVSSRPYHNYRKVETWIDPETDMPTRIVFYDRAGQLFKTQFFEDVADFGGHPFPQRVRLDDEVTGIETTLHFEQVRFDTGLTLEDLDTHALTPLLLAGGPLIEAVLSRAGASEARASGSSRSDPSEARR